MADRGVAEAGRAPEPLAPVPWTAVGAVCVGLLTALLLVAQRYGWHRDELYFLEAGRHHLAWGYVDQPPLTPFLARLADGLAPGNLVVLRTPPALAASATVVLGVLLTRELGGRRTAQAAASVAMVGGFALGVGHLLSTAAFDLTAWMALLWLAARLLRTGDPRWWLAFGAVAGVAMENKDLVVLLAGALLVGLVMERRWDLLLTPWAVAGGALALLLAAPNLVWQAHHGWPQLEMADALSKRLAGEDRATLLPLQLLFVGPTLVPVLWSGARWLAGPTARRFRPLLWAWPAGLLAAFATGGRPYYVLPLTTAVMLAGLVDRAQRGQGRLLAWLVGLGLVATVPLALPLLPVRHAGLAGTVNEAVTETVGWPELVDQVALVVLSLPPEQRADIILLTATYGEAGAIDRFGPSRGLPRAYSGHNSYADFGIPDTDTDATIVAVRYSVRTLEQWFQSCRLAARVDNGLGVDNEVQGAPIVVCHGLRGPWSVLWEAGIRHLS